MPALIYLVFGPLAQFGASEFSIVSNCGNGDDGTQGLS